jgi:peptidoglycan/xylan/chitin deacetylase (PgdA/CDA1 family)
LTVRKLALRAMRSCGVFALTRAWSAGMARVLMYHNFSGPDGIDPNALNAEGTRAQFEHLRRHFKVVRLQQIAEQVTSGRALDEKMVALTVDDGRRNCYRYLFPLLKEFEFSATFFVVSSFIRGEDWIWTDKVLWLSQQPDPPQELAPDRLNSVFQTMNLVRPEERNERIQAMARKAGLVIPRTPPDQYAPCSWSELREMVDSGLVEIGSHSATHPIFSSITDEESWDELIRSRAQIEEGMGRSVSCFCFPNGLAGDFRPSQVGQVRDAGYSYSVTAQFGLVKSGADRYQLPRIGMARKRRPEEIAKYLDGAAYYQQKLLGRFLNHAE